MTESRKSHEHEESLASLIGLDGEIPSEAFPSNNLPKLKTKSKPTSLIEALFILGFIETMKTLKHPEERQNKIDLIKLRQRSQPEIHDLSQKLQRNNILTAIRYPSGSISLSIYTTSWPHEKEIVVTRSNNEVLVTIDECNEGNYLRRCGEVTLKNGREDETLVLVVANEQMEHSESITRNYLKVLRPAVEIFDQFLSIPPVIAREQFVDRIISSPTEEDDLISQLINNPRWTHEVTSGSELDTNLQ